LWFGEKEPSKVDNIEKTLQIVLPSERVLQHQYCARNYQNYSDLILVLLQAEKHDKLTLRNHHQRFMEFASLLEVHHNVKGKEKIDGYNNHQKNLVNSRMANTTAKTRKTEPKVKEKGEAKLLNAINVGVQTTLLKNVEPPPP
jgi:hypothetical protein